ncbi:hypothetical protein RAD15_17570 [Bradyrhizobium sp. 14AA]
MPATSKPNSIVREEPNALEKVFAHFAERLRDAPGAKRLARLARTAGRIPEPLLEDLTALMLQVDDVQLVGSDIALHLIEVGFCDVSYADAADFASELRTRLRDYVRDPRVASNARGDLKDCVAWWSMALGRAAELCRWSATVLMER